jgi:hypothetical protein
MQDLMQASARPTLLGTWDRWKLTENTKNVSWVFVFLGLCVRGVFDVPYNMNKLTVLIGLYLTSPVELWTL